jgi:hypothetical protein
MIYGIRRKGTTEALLFPMSGSSCQQIEGSYDQGYVATCCALRNATTEGTPFEVFILSDEDEPPPSIAVVDTANPTRFVGDGERGVYITVAQGADGWYSSALSTTQEALVSDAGPFEGQYFAEMFSVDKAQAWCIAHTVNYLPSTHPKHDELQALLERRGMR